MIRRNYNGNVNRTVIRDLKKMYTVNERNEINLFEAFFEKEKVSVYENLYPILGCPDELSTVVTLRDETEIKEYLKKDFAKRVDEISITEFKEYLKKDLIKRVDEIPVTEIKEYLKKDFIRRVDEYFSH